MPWFSSLKKIRIRVVRFEMLGDYLWLHEESDQCTFTAIMTFSVILNECSDVSEIFNFKEADVLTIVSLQ